MHRAVAVEVAVDLLERGALIVRQRERQRLKPAGGELSPPCQDGRGARCPAERSAPEQCELHQQQLLKRQPLPGRLAIPLGREVRRRQRPLAIGQPLTRAHGRGQRLDHLGQLVDVFAHQREDLSR